MKLNLQIELDWIDEESNLDDAIQHQVIDKVTDSIQGLIKEQTEQKILDKVDNIIDGKVKTTYDQFMKSEIAITDKYGDVKETYKSLKELIKKRFDKYITESVDEKGNKSTSSYGIVMRRIDYIVDNRLEKMTKKFTDDAINTITQNIESVLTQNLKDKMGGKIFKLLEISKMLEAKNGK